MIRLKKLLCVVLVVLMSVTTIATAFPFAVYAGIDYDAETGTSGNDQWLDGNSAYALRTAGEENIAGYRFSVYNDNDIANPRTSGTKLGHSVNILLTSKVVSSLYILTNADGTDYLDKVTVANNEKNNTGESYVTEAKIQKISHNANGGATYTILPATKIGFISHGGKQISTFFDFSGGSPYTFKYGTEAADLLLTVADNCENDALFSNDPNDICDADESKWGYKYNMGFITNLCGVGYRGENENRANTFESNDKIFVEPLIYVIKGGTRNTDGSLSGGEYFALTASELALMQCDEINEHDADASGFTDPCSPIEGTDSMAWYRAVAHTTSGKFPSWLFVPQDETKTKAYFGVTAVHDNRNGSEISRPSVSTIGGVTYYIGSHSDCGQYTYASAKDIIMNLVGVGIYCPYESLKKTTATVIVRKDDISWAGSEIDNIILRKDGATTGITLSPTADGAFSNVAVTVGTYEIFAMKDEEVATGETVTVSEHGENVGYVDFYTVTATATPSGCGTVEPQSIITLKNSTIAYTGISASVKYGAHSFGSFTARAAVPAGSERYRFVNWSLAPTSVTEPTLVIASFEQYNLQNGVTVLVYKDDILWDTNDISYIRLYKGESFIGLALTSEGYAFAHDNVPSGSYAISVGYDHGAELATGETITVVEGEANVGSVYFYTVTTMAGEGIKSVTGGGIYLKGTNVALSAVTKDDEAAGAGIAEIILKNNSIYIEASMFAAQSISEGTAYTFIDSGATEEGYRRYIVQAPTGNYRLCFDGVPVADLSILCIGAGFKTTYNSDNIKWTGTVSRNSASLSIENINSPHIEGATCKPESQGVAETVELLTLEIKTFVNDTIAAPSDISEWARIRVGDYDYTVSGEKKVIIGYEGMPYEIATKADKTATTYSAYPRKTLSESVIERLDYYTVTIDKTEGVESVCFSSPDITDANTATFLKGETPTINATIKPDALFSPPSYATVTLYKDDLVFTEEWLPVSIFQNDILISETTKSKNVYTSTSPITSGTYDIYVGTYKAKAGVVFTASPSSVMTSFDWLRWTGTYLGDEKSYKLSPLNSAVTETATAISTNNTITTESMTRIDYYSVTATAAPLGYGSVSPQSVIAISGSEITYVGGVATVKRDSHSFGAFTATATEPNEQCRYSFSKWSPAPIAVIGPTIITANFTATNTVAVSLYKDNLPYNDIGSDFDVFKVKLHKEGGQPIIRNATGASLIFENVPEGNYNVWIVNSEDNKTEYMYASGLNVSTAEITTQDIHYYTVTPLANPDGYGMVPSERTDSVCGYRDGLSDVVVPYMTVSLTSETNPLVTQMKKGGRTIASFTAVQSASTEIYTYSFANWSPAAAYITAPTTITANFTRETTENIVTIIVRKDDIGWAGHGISSVIINNGINGDMPLVNLKNGSFSIGNVPSGTYAVLVTMDGNRLDTNETVIVSETGESVGYVDFYTVTVEASPVAYGMVAPQSIVTLKNSTIAAVGTTASVVYNGSVIEAANASPKEYDGAYRYEFDRWTASTITVSAPATITAHFTRISIDAIIEVYINDSPYLDLPSAFSFQLRNGSERIDAGTEAKVNEYTFKTNSAVLSNTYDVYLAVYGIPVAYVDTGVDISMTADSVTVRVDFYSVSITKGAGIESVSGTGLYLKGTTASLSAVPFSPSSREISGTARVILRKDGETWTDKDIQIAKGATLYTMTSGQFLVLENGTYAVMVDGKDTKKQITVNASQSSSFGTPVWTGTVDSTKESFEIVMDRKIEESVSAEETIIRDNIGQELEIDYYTVTAAVSHAERGTIAPASVVTLSGSTVAFEGNTATVTYEGGQVEKIVTAAKEHDKYIYTLTGWTPSANVPLVVNAPTDIIANYIQSLRSVTVVIRKDWVSGGNDNVWTGSGISSAKIINTDTNEIIALASNGDGYSFTAHKMPQGNYRVIIGNASGNETDGEEFAMVGDGELFVYLDFYTVIATASPVGYGTVSPESIIVLDGATASYATNAVSIMNGDDYVIHKNGALTIIPSASPQTTFVATKTADTSYYTYSFEGWNPSPVTLGMGQDNVITANFERTLKTVTITYKPNGGKINNSSFDVVRTYGIGETITLLGTTSPSGKKLAGWAQTKNNNKYSRLIGTQGTKYTIVSDVVVYATYVKGTKNADIGITANAVHGRITKGIQFISSATIVNHSAVDILPSHHVDAVATLYIDGVEARHVTLKDVFVPANNRNLIRVTVNTHTWETDKKYSVGWSLDYSNCHRLIDRNSKNNKSRLKEFYLNVTSTITNTARPDYATNPDPDYNGKIVADKTSVNTYSWEYWTYSNGKYRRISESDSMIITLIFKPENLGGLRRYEYGAYNLHNYTTRSGFGFSVHSPQYGWMTGRTAQYSDACMCSDCGARYPMRDQYYEFRGELLSSLKCLSCKKTGTIIRQQSSIIVKSNVGTPTVIMTYPELNYSQAAGKASILTVTPYEGADNMFTMTLPQYSHERDEIYEGADYADTVAHYTPMWYKDGVYKAVTRFGGMWTPVGEITAVVQQGELAMMTRNDTKGYSVEYVMDKFGVYANAYIIEGSMYDDIYTGSAR